MEELVGRKHERDELLRCSSSKRSELVIIYGRRRIGKTFLVNRTFDDRFSFYFTGSHKAPKERQLERFAQALQQYGGMKFCPKIDSWYHAFDALQQMLSGRKSKKKVIFFDEMPWMDTKGSDFVAAFEDFWNTWAALRDDICMIACGSATSWMVDKIVENQGGLHNRVTSRIYLRPFSLAETEEYARTHGCVWDRYTLTQCYMYIGGVPFYLSLMDFHLDLPTNIDRLFFASHARLADEFNELFNVLFSESTKYIEIVRLLASHREGLTRQEIAASLPNGGTLTKRLENLLRCDFISTNIPFAKKKKGAIYQLSDFFTLFYFRFIEGVPKTDSSYWALKMRTPQVRAWQGLTFELVCKVHISNIIHKLGISGVLTQTSSWRSRSDSKESGKTQIDIVIEREDRYIYLCEVKFSESPFVIDKSYEKILREKMSVFQEETKTRKTLLTSFITTFGVKPGIHSGIVQNEVMLDDLFL